jgi:cyclopropane fatty-acyl-phospholipid synthase-like methyltransferase
MIPAAEAMAELLGKAGRVLDIAAGHGMFGITLAKHDPDARITALDWPNVLEVARDNAVRAGVADRHTLLGGDAFKTDFGGPYDTVLVTNFFHHFDRPTNVQLMRKVHACLVPGGRCVTLEFVPNDDRVSPPTAAAFAMQMLGGTPAGDAYTYREYQSMFGEAGFTHNTIHVLPTPEQIIISTK